MPPNWSTALVILVILLICSLLVYGLYSTVSQTNGVQAASRKKQNYTTSPGTKMWRIIFSGCARNIEPYIEDSIKAMYTLIQQLPLADYRIIIYHNDSVDNTLSILQKYAAKDKARFIDRKSVV